MTAHRLVLIATLTTLLPALAAAQSSSTATPPSSTQPAAGQGQSGSGSSTQNQGAASAQEPVPYTPGEFPPWLVDLRRAEVITVGAFPIALLVSSLGYQLTRYASKGFATAYAPSLFGGGSAPLTNQEKTGVLISGAVLSMVVAFIDYELGRREPKK